MKIRNVFFLVIIASLLVLGACSKDKDDSEAREEAQENLQKEGFPIVKEPITIKVFSGKAATTADDWNDVPLLNKYEEMTNVKMEWNQVAIDGLAERRNLELAKGDDLPDLFYGAYIPNSDLFKYGQQGIFVPLNDLIDEYAPNIKKYLEEYPEVKKGITFPDGNIYSVPTLHHPEAMTSLMEDKPWINKDILDELGMDNPETTEEFYDYLKAATELTVDGEPVIGWSSILPSRLFHLTSGAFGVRNKGLMHQLIDEDPETGNPRFFPITDEQKELLKYMNKLYSEGLIEQNIYSIEVDQFLANGSQGRYAAMNFFNPVDYFGEEVGSRYIPGNALEGPEGHKQYTGMVSAVRGLGHFSITKNNVNPEATIRWIDYFWSDEGAKMFFMGLEDETYEETDSGPELLPVITDNPDGLTVQEALAKYIINPGGGHPVLNNPEYSTAPEFRPEDIENAEHNADHLVDSPWPPFLFTADEEKDLEAIVTDIAKFVSETEAQFVTGEKDFSEWDAYVEQLKKMRLDEYMDIQQAAFERFQED